MLSVALFTRFQYPAWTEAKPMNLTVNESCILASPPSGSTGWLSNAKQKYTHFLVVFFSFSSLFFHEMGTVLVSEALVKALDVIFCALFENEGPRV